MKLDQLVEKYVKVRDKKAELKKAYETEAKKYEDALVKMEAMILKIFEETGQDSAKTQFGTAYTSPRVSATVADRDAFLTWVLQDPAERTIFLENRVSKTAVEQYKGVHDDLPPGINWTSILTIGVRRA